MESPCNWCSLPSFPGLPALLVSACFGESSYTIHITDLANIWVEKLDRRGILLRSLQENTSIDLVDAGPEQWAVFLSKLTAALDPKSPDHHLTSLSISNDDNSKDHDCIKLHVTCELPKPLADFKWPIRLTKCQPVSLTSELVLPLIHEHYVQRREADDLKSQLKEKDALIKKLLDKLSTMHTPLELIFNSLSAKHGTTRAAAEERIKGLAPFDEEKWRSQRGQEGARDATALLRSVFGDSKFSCAANPDLGASDTLNDWWTKLGSVPHAASRTEANSLPEEPTEAMRVGIDSPVATGNEDFQVQATPARRSPQSPTGGKSAAAEATESDESDVPDSYPTRPQNKSRPKLGTLGNTKTPAQERPVSQSSHTLRPDEDATASESDDEGHTALSENGGRVRARLGTIGRSKQSSQSTGTAAAVTPEVEAGDETASGSDSADDGLARPPSSSKGAPIAMRKGALGRIGGKSKDTKGSTQAPEGPVSDTRSDDATLPEKAEVRKIGAIGRKAHTEPKNVNSNVPTEPEEPETGEQKAERKRNELARELSRQNAAPVKKRRKF